jgi:5'-nucleotidase
MNNRRKFLQTSSLITTGFLLGKPFKTIAGRGDSAVYNENLTANDISVLYTADLNGQVGSFNLGRLNSIGGLHNVYSTIKQDSPSHLLLDGGDFLNEKGASEDHSNMIAMMNKTGYHAATIGDKELSNGEDHLASLIPLMDFKLVNCNYEFSNPVLKSKILKFHIVNYNGYRVGLTGVGPEIPDRSSAGIVYHQPYEIASEVAMYLKKRLNCDMVICLSHLGLEQENDGPNNKNFAAASKNIDVIIGGHNNGIAHPQMALRNSEKSQVIVGNAAYGGSVLGKLQFTFNEQKEMQLFTCRNFSPGATNSSFYTGYKQLCA